MQKIFRNSKCVKRPKQTAGSRRCVIRPATVSAFDLVANGFMKQRFLPVCSPVQNLPPQKITEKVFFKSLSKVAATYKFHLLDVTNYSYPANILIAHWDAQLKIDPDGESLLQWNSEDTSQGQLCIETELNIGGTLYFIPIMPLFLMLRRRESRKAAHLITGVFAYLRQKAQLPFYLDEDQAVYGHYICCADYALEDEDYDGNDNSGSMSYELRQANICGKFVDRKISSAAALRSFQTNISRFRPKSHMDHRAKEIACAFRDLYQDFPKGYIFKNFQGLDPEEEEYIDMVYPNQYISFISHNKGRIFDQIFEWTNDESSNSAGTYVPRATQKFKKSTKRPLAALEFEKRLFGLLQRLSLFLNTIS